MENHPSRNWKRNSRCMFSFQLSCCAIHRGKIPNNPAKFDPLVGIQLPCYEPNEAQPDEVSML
jgi:hypothetical protein